jgi:hypothetical protein
MLYRLAPSESKEDMRESKIFASCLKHRADRTNATYPWIKLSTRPKRTSEEGKFTVVISGQACCAETLTGSILSFTRGCMCLEVRKYVDLLAALVPAPC